MSNLTPSRIRQALSGEFASGLVILLAATLGFTLANSPVADAFSALRNTHIGIPGIGLELSVGHWASDGLLAVFFFVVGLELKREFTEGALRSPSTAIVPVIAACGGVLVPALLYLSVNINSGSAHGWAIPTATDIAFAIAVLGLIAPGIPPALRLFLLTLAVVDDFIAIAIIAVFYSDSIHVAPLALAALPALIFALLLRRYAERIAYSRLAPWVSLLPLGLVTWALFYSSGVHATIAGVLLAFLVPVRSASGTAIAEHLAERFAPLSNLVAVPIFALFAAGVSLSDTSRFPADPIAIGVLLGLVIGKPLGITLVTWALTRFTNATLGPGVTRRETIGVSALAGVGFTVAMLISELSFSDPADADTARLAVMVASLLAVALASALLIPGAKKRASAREEAADSTSPRSA